MAALHILEHDPKRRRNKNEGFWILTTDLSLSIEEAQEAAHQRWLPNLPCHRIGLPRSRGWGDF